MDESGAGWVCDQWDKKGCSEREGFATDKEVVANFSPTSVLEKPHNVSEG